MKSGSLDAWRDRPAAQQPDWPDQAAVADVAAELARIPPLVFSGECDRLKERLASVARGEAFILQGGDCAETFAGSTADAAADGGHSHLRRQRAGGQDRAAGRAVRQTAIQEYRDQGRARIARLPR